MAADWTPLQWLLPVRVGMSYPGAWQPRDGVRGVSSPRDHPEMAEQRELEAELEFVKSLAAEAAVVALARAKRVTPVEKANLSYVTDLDQDLEQLIRRRLGERFPHDQITGE